MSLFISSLNSGSNGNCYYIGNSTQAILVDAGISCREIEKRMKRLELQIDKLKAIFVSHEHSDHIRGVQQFTKKYRLPVYITAETLKYTGIKLDKELVRFYKAHEPVNVGNMSITPFPKYHDASDPYSFTVEYKRIRVGVFTDIGRVCDRVISHFKHCHAAFLEANYDEQMLEVGGYPNHLKNRIRGGMGHLSNKQAFELFMNHKPEFMSHLVLSHLSENNNRPELVQELFNSIAGSVTMIVASRFRETEVLQVGVSNLSDAIPAHHSVSQQQLSFSFI